MKPPSIAIVFVILWLGIVGLPCIHILLNGLPNVRQILQPGMTGLSPISLIPFGMIIFMCLMCYFGFKTESRKSKKFLATLLDGEEAKDYEFSDMHLEKL